MATWSKWVEASPGEPVAEVAARSLAGRLQAVQDYLGKAAQRSGENVEYVHQMRVWCRRAAAALRLYEPLLPGWRAEQLSRNLKRIRRAANDARDDDVFLQRLAADQSDPLVELLLSKLRAHRRRAQQVIAAVHRRFDDGQRLQRRIVKLLKRVGTGRRSAAGQVALGEWARPQLRREVDQFFAAACAPLSDCAALHQLRIAGKNLRYTLELLGTALGPSSRAELYALTRDLQDRLGEINDHFAAERRLAHWVDESPSSAARDYLQARAAREAEAATRQHGAFLTWWTASRCAQLRAAFDQALIPCLAHPDPKR